MGITKERMLPSNPPITEERKVRLIEWMVSEFGPEKPGDNYGDAAQDWADYFDLMDEVLSKRPTNLAV